MLNDGINERNHSILCMIDTDRLLYSEPALDVNGWICLGIPAAGLMAGGIIVTLWLKKLKDKNKAGIANANTLAITNRKRNNGKII